MEKSDSQPPKDTIRPEALRPGYTVLLAGYSFLMGFAYDKFPDDIAAQVVPDRLMALMAEYAVIYTTIAQVVGKERIRVIRNPIRVHRGNEDIVLEVPPEYAPDIKENRFEYFDEFWRQWPKNAFSVIGDDIFLASGSVHQQYEYKARRLGEYWNIGNGGTFDHESGYAVYTGKLTPQEKRILAQRAIRSIHLPKVDAEKQPNQFPENDLDSHVKLIKTRTGEVVLYIAASYLYQDEPTTESIKTQAQQAQLLLRISDDSKLPPLSHNFLKLHGGHVIVSGPEDSELVQQLRIDLGCEKIHVTSVPIVLIPKHAGGSIDCMTNLLPPNVFLL